MFEKIERQALWVLGVCAFCVTAVHLLTIGDYPPAWFDEIEILEMGRFSIFDVHPEWSVNLVETAEGGLAAPLPYFHYLSGWVMETLYRLTGTFLWSRVLFLLSLPICALSLFGWLRVRQFPAGVSLLTALFFLLDPNATICAHWYRPDLWCMTFVFTSLVLIARSGQGRRRTLSLAAAGALLAVSVFFWITSALLVPLALLELWRLEDRRGRSFVAVGIGGTLAASLLMVPLYRYVPEIVHQYATRSELASMGSAGPDLAGKVLANSFDFVKIALRSPFVWLMAVVGAVVGRRSRLHLAYFLFLIAFMIATRVYHLRMVYLMPCLFLLAAEAIQAVACSVRPVVRNLGRGYVVLSLLAVFGISVVALTFAAWPEENTLRAFTDRLWRAVPGSAPKVYLMDMEHELYYAGRRLGWQMYSASPRAVVFNGRHADFLAKIDAVAVTSCEPKLTEADFKAIASAGFRKTTTISMPPAATGALKSKLAGTVYAHGYPSCEIWTRSR